MKRILECCVDSPESALNAYKGGADRLELCQDLIVGGTTPTLALYREVRKLTPGLRVHVLLRPRFGDFLYSDYEMDILEEEVAEFRKAGADGVVIGCLTPEGDLDLDKMKRLLAQRGDMSVTLHRAFDVCKDPFKTLEECKELGIDTILTSGHKKSALEGKDLIAELVRRAEGKVDILAGAGVNASVISAMLETIPLTSFHMSGKVTLESGMKYRKEGVPMGLDSFSEFDLMRTDETLVRKASRALDAGLERWQ